MLLKSYYETTNGVEHAFDECQNCITFALMHIMISLMHILTSLMHIVISLMHILI